MSKVPKILIIYTGGTIGMVLDEKSNSLKPVNFKHITKHVPDLQKLPVIIDAVSLDKPIDSSNMNIKAWQDLASIIEKNYQSYEGFVVLHGSDTMSYTASVLSFMFENLNKPIVFTGSQLPIGVLRTDGKENLLTSIEIAAAVKHNGQALVPEVCIYFEYQLYRGNRTHKYSAENFKAFESANYPILAQAGVNIQYFETNILPNTQKPLKVHYALNNNLAILTLFPGINTNYVEALLQIKNLQALIIYSFGAGNIPLNDIVTDTLQKLNKRGVLLLNVTQCNMGNVNMSKYATNPDILNINILDGGDLTLEAAVTKLMFLLGQEFSTQKIRKILVTSLRGEITEL